LIAETLNSYRLTLDYLKRLIDDLPDEALTGQRGIVNHPFWTIGHLVFSAQMIGGELALVPWLPEEWTTTYGTGSVPVADRAAYPSKESLLERLFDAERRLGERLSAIGEEGMAQPLPDERFRAMFPTLGHAVVHVLVAHTAAHIGQVVVWRRLMEYPPLTKVYD
jgi:hypothetical protein